MFKISIRRKLHDEQRTYGQDRLKENLLERSIADREQLVIEENRKE